MKTYGRLDLTVSSPPQTFTEKITVEEARDFLRGIPGGIEDDVIGGIIASVRNDAEIAQNIDLIPKQYDLWLDYFPACEIQLRNPLASVDLIRYIDSDGTETDLDAASYAVDTSRGIVTPLYGETWPCFTPRPSSAVLVRFTSGHAADAAFWSNAGAGLLTRMKMAITDAYDNRGVPEDPDRTDRLLRFGATPKVF